MNISTETIKDPLPRSEPRELKTLSVRVPLEVHERIEKAAKDSGQSLNQFMADAATEAARVILNGGAINRPMLAVFVDLDSFAGRPTINMEALGQLVLSMGRPIVTCSYSSTSMKDVDASRQALLTRFFRHEELRSREEVRLRLAAEALDTISKGVREFIIVSGDEEFGLLADLLKRKGANVMGVCVRTPAETSPEFIRPFESFRYYDQIDRPPESNELEQLRVQYAEILIQLVLKLETRGAKAVGAALIQILKDRHPDVSLGLLELRNWRELAEIARDRGLVAKIEPSGADFLVKLSEDGHERAAALLRDSEAESAQRGEVNDIRRAIADILGTELPEVSVRFLIFNAVQWVLNEEMTQDGISLIDLSYRVTGHIGPSKVQQNTVFRLVNGLFRCGAFDFLPNQANEYDPRLLRARIPMLRFDDAFTLNLFRVRKKFPVHSSVENISEAIYGTPNQKKKVEVMLSLAADPSFGRNNLAETLARLDKI